MKGFKMLKLLEKSQFDKVYKILEESFPADERRRYDEQKALVDNNIYKIYTLNHGGEIEAFIAVYEFESFIFVEHFAVGRDFRGKGIGTDVLSELRNIYSDMICLEVELPLNDESARRIDFYRKNGFFLNDFEYEQPPISNGRNSVPMKIMTSQRLLSANEFKMIKAILYSRVYGINNNQAVT